MTTLQRTLLNTTIRELEVVKPKRTRHSVSVSLETYHALMLLKKELMHQNASSISFNAAIHDLLKSKYQLSKVQAELDETKQKNANLMVEENNFLKQIVMNQSRQQPQMYMGMPVMANNTTQYSNTTQFSNTNQFIQANGFAPPPPPPLKQHLQNIQKNRKPYRPPNTGNLKKDYVNEIKQIFTGEMLKPSDILHTTKPKHCESEVSLLDENFEIPEIECISVAKQYQPSQKVSIVS